MTSDEALMLEFQQGSSDAFTELFRRYREPIYGYFRRRLQDQPRAEELAQETFLAILKSAERYEPRALFRTYLYGIAVKMVWAERRKAGNRPACSPDRSSDGRQAREMPDPASIADPDAGLVPSKADSLFWSCASVWHPGWRCGRCCCSGRRGWCGGELAV
jgi:RNA polymerase sigma-70 factor (ECF subfamily)